MRKCKYGPYREVRKLIVLVSGVEPMNPSIGRWVGRLVGPMVFRSNLLIID